MFTFDRDTATIVAVLMCIVATVYMYRELNKTKSEINNVKGFYGNVMEYLSRPSQKTTFGPRVSEPEPEKENKEVSETQVDEDEDESSE